MPIDKGDGREQRPPNDWERIDTEKSARDAAQRKYDETHDPSEEWERAARPLPADHGKDRPATRTVSADQLAEMVEMWGQDNVDRMRASGRLAVEQGEDTVRTSDQSSAEHRAETDDGLTDGRRPPHELPPDAVETIMRDLDRHKRTVDNPRTRGLWVDEHGGSDEIVSGEDDLAATARQAMRDRGLPDLTVQWDVETKAAARMLQTGEQNLTLVVNKDVCTGQRSCDAVIPVILPRGYTLRIHDPSGPHEYEGTAEP